MFETMFKQARIERTCALQERSGAFKVSFAKELRVEDFGGMMIFLQESKYVPVPGGAECMLCTVTLGKDSPALQALGEENRRVILVGEAFLRLPHVKKLLLLRAEQLRQEQHLTEDMGRPEGVASTSLDREIASRERLAWEFKPKLIERTLKSRDGVVVKSATRVAKGIYANSDDHYKPARHPLGKGGKEHRFCVVTEEDREEEQRDIERWSAELEEPAEGMKATAAAEQIRETPERMGGPLGSET